jgi:nitroreductase
MGHRLDGAALDAVFREARTHFKWQPRPVADDTLRELYDLLKWAPTSANAAPARFAFLRSKEAKERLRPALAPANVEKTMTAPVTVIVAYDLKFYDQLPRLFPHSPGMAKMFQTNSGLVESAGRVSDRGGTGARPRLWTDVRLRSSESRRRILRRRQAVLRLRAGILSRGTREVELPLQPRVRRSVGAASAAAAALVRRSVFAPVAP